MDKDIVNLSKILDLPSFLNQNDSKIIGLLKPKKKHYGHSSYNIIREASSGEESCIESNEAGSIPSIKQVCRELIDPNTIRVVRSKKLIPLEVKSYLLFTCIEASFNSFTFKAFIEDLEIFKDLQISPVIQEIKIIKHSNNLASALVSFLKDRDAEIIKGFFSHPIKLANPTFNSCNQEMRVFWAYNILDLKLSEWYGIVFRGLPLKVNEETLRTHCANCFKSSEELTDLDKHIKFVSNPTRIKSIMCAIVQTTSLDTAEKLCLELNKKKTGSQILKVHLHPKCCRLRFNFSKPKFRFKDNKSTLTRPRILENNKVLFDESKNFIEEITLEELISKINSYYCKQFSNKQRAFYENNAELIVQHDNENRKTLPESLVKEESTRKVNNNAKVISPEYSFDNLFVNNNQTIKTQNDKTIHENIQTNEKVIENNNLNIKTEEKIIHDSNTSKNEGMKTMIEILKENLKKPKGLNNNVDEKPQIDVTKIASQAESIISNLNSNIIYEKEFDINMLQNIEDTEVILVDKVKSWEAKFPDNRYLKEILIKDFQSQTLNFYYNKNSSDTFYNNKNNIPNYLSRNNLNTRNSNISMLANNNILSSSYNQSTISTNYSQNNLLGMNFLKDSLSLNTINNNFNGSMIYSNLIQSSRIQSLYQSTYQNINNNESNIDVLNTLIKGKPSNQIPKSENYFNNGNSDTTDKSFLNKKRLTDLNNSRKSSNEELNLK